MSNRLTGEKEGVSFSWFGIFKMKHESKLFSELSSLAAKYKALLEEE